MRKGLVDLLRCPFTGCPLKAEVEAVEGDEIISGELVAEGTGQRYAIVAGIPRFVPPGHYAETFGFEWRTFARTQLDSVW